jgi:hypothetical protein
MTRGNDGEAPTTLGLKMGLVTSVDWKDETRIDDIHVWAFYTPVA